MSARPKGSENSVLQEVDAVIKQNAMLQHSFYQLWNEGKLTKETLREYAKQYYAQVHAFPAYVSGVHSHCDDLDVRRILLENLIEEEQGVDNHPELWLRFAEGLGVSRKEVGTAELLTETKESVATLKSITQSDNFLEGLAALYAYESQIPEVSKTKRQGLKKFYDLDDRRAVSFFTVHEKADIEHSQVERDILEQYCTDEASRKRVVQAAETSAKALSHFLDGVQRAFVN